MSIIKMNEMNETAIQNKTHDVVPECFSILTWLKFNGGMGNLSLKTVTV